MLPCDVYASTPSTMVSRRGCWVWYGTSSLCCCVHQLQLHAATSSVRIGQKLILSHQAEIAQVVARRSHNPKVVSSILTFRMAWRCLVSYALARAVDHCRLGPGPSAFQTDTSRLSRHGHEFLGGLGYPSTAEINKSDHTRSRTWICRGHSPQKKQITFKGNALLKETPLDWKPL